MNNSYFLKRLNLTIDQLYDEVVQLRSKVLEKDPSNHVMLDRIERVKFDAEDLKSLINDKPFQDSNDRGPTL